MVREKTYSLRLTPSQAFVLREALNEAIDACTHQLAMGAEPEEWHESRDSYEAVEEAILKSLSAIASKAPKEALIKGAHQ